MNLIDSGRFELSETGMDVPPGTVVGKLGMLSRRWPAPRVACCRETGDEKTLSDDRFEELHSKIPSLG